MNEQSALQEYGNWLLIEMLFGAVQTRMSRRNHVLDKGTCGHYLVNIMERSVLDSDAGCHYQYAVTCLQLTYAVQNISAIRGKKRNITLQH